MRRDSESPSEARVTVRAAEAADLARLTELEEAAFGARSWSRQQLAAELTHLRSSCFLATAADTVEPTAYAIYRTVADEAELLRVGVHPGRRRRGVASRLLLHSLAIVAAGGARRCYLEVAADNRGAVALYRGLGYTSCGRRAGYYPGGADALLFERAL